MILTYHAAHVYELRQGTLLSSSPHIETKQTLQSRRISARTSLSSTHHPDMNGAEEASRGDKKPFVIFGPGEYEVKEITASGFPTVSKDKPNDLINTVYSLKFDGLNVLYLGCLATTDLPSELLEMDEPDVLIIPVGGGQVLSPADVQKLSVKLEAKIVIPIMYDDKSLKQFFERSRCRGHESRRKLTVKLRDVAEKQTKSSCYPYSVVLQRTIDNLRERPHHERRAVAFWMP